MSKTIRVLLLEDVASVGRAGEVVSVSEGYARNFLFPEAKAALATQDVQARHAHAKAKQQEAADAHLQALQQLAEHLDRTELTVEVRVKEGDEIFGSVGARQIADELKRQAKLDVKAKDIELETPLTHLGSQKITINLSPDVAATIQVTLVPDPASLPATDDD